MLNRNGNIEANVQLESVELGEFTEIKAGSVIANSIIGDFSYLAGYNQVDYAKIGKFCSLATFVRINPGNHPSYTRVAQHHFTYRSALFGMGENDAAFFDWRKEHFVTIGNDVWIGHNAVIMAGVTVGNGAVIGTGAIVTKDVEPYAVMVGVPAKKIKMRFSADIVAKLEKSAWWDWDYEVLKERLADFKNIDLFLEKYC